MVVYIQFRLCAVRLYYFPYVTFSLWWVKVHYSGLVGCVSCNAIHLRWHILGKIHTSFGIYDLTMEFNLIDGSKWLNNNHHDNTYRVY